MSGREYDAPAVRKAILLIELLCDSSQPLGVSEISQRLDINKNMVFRLIRTLTELGWLTTDNYDKLKYRMTLQPFRYTSKIVSRMNVRTAAIGPLRQLWEATQTSCYLCILEKHRALCIEHLDGTGVLRVAGSVGSLYHLHTNAPGKILLAYDESGLIEQLDKSDMPKLTRNTISDKRLLKKHLEKVRQQGYAIDDMENAEGVICYAVPIFNYENKVVGTIGLSSLTFNYSTEKMIKELGPLVNKAGKMASQIMGVSEKTSTGTAGSE